MGEFISKHPIKITLAVAIAVVFAIITATFKVSAGYTNLKFRVKTVEKNFVEYEVKDFPKVKDQVGRIENKVDKLIDSLIGKQH